MLQSDVLHAARRGEIKKITKWLKKAGSMIDAQTPDEGSTLLHAAVFNGQYDLVRDLLKRGATVDLHNKEGSIALMVATEVGDLTCVKILLDHSADVILQNLAGINAIMQATLHNRHQALRLLLQHRPTKDVNLRDGNGSTALIMAATSDATMCAMELLSAGADVEIECCAGKSALRHASERGLVTMQQLLLRNRAQERGSPLGPTEVRLDMGGGHTVTVPESVLRPSPLHFVRNAPEGAERAEPGGNTRRGMQRVRVDSHALARRTIIARDLMRD
jgi:ankyrin repeat protein